MKGCRALAAALMALAAWAQGQPLSGVLIDPSGTPVAGVPAVLSSPAGERISQTGPEGAFRFDGLAPGSYRLRILVPGFDPVDQGVRPGGRLVVRLKLAVLKERVTVAGQGAQISTALDSNRDAISVERELLENLPVLDLDYIAALSRFLDPATAAEGGPSLIVDGMEARNAGVTPSAIQEIKINQNPYTVEYPRWSRRRIEVITRTAADRYHGTLNLLFRDHHLNAREAFALLRPPERRRIVEGSLFGPIGRGQKMSFLLSGMRESENLQAVVFARGPEGAIIRNTPTPQQNTYGSLRISRQFGDAQSMFWQVNFQDRWQNNVGVGGTLLPESGLQSRFREDEFLFNHRAVITPALLSQFRILLGRFWAPARSNLAAPKLVVSDAFTGGGAQGDVLRTEVHTSITWLLTRTAGSHTMKFGFNVPDWSRRGLSDRSNQLGTFYFGSLEDFRLGRPFAAVLQQGEPKTVFTEKTLGAFFQDEWQARQNLSIAAGLRYDWQNYFGDRNNVSPRLALAWAPGGARKTVVRAGAGYFFERSGPGPIWDILRFDGARLKRYVVSDPAPAWLGPATGLPAASVARLEPGVELPETLQFSVGLERQLAKKTTLAVNYVGTRGIHQLRSRDANAPLPPLFAARPDARVNVLRLIEAAGRVEGNALEVTLRGAIAPRVAGLAQYTFGRTMSDTGGVNWFPAASFAPDGEWGRADGDRRHQFNLLANATLHRWLNLGISASLLSGQPFNVTTGGDQNRDGLASDRPPALGRNTGKGPGQVALDLRWYREFRLRPEAGEKGPMIVVSLDAFNLPNRVNYQNYLGALSSPFFGRPVATLPARRLQAAARFQF